MGVFGDGLRLFPVWHTRTPIPLLGTPVPVLAKRESRPKWIGAEVQTF